MTNPPRLQAALDRLDAALDLLDAAAARRAQADAERHDLDEEFVLMQDDRARLAVELDLMRVRAETLDQAVDAATARLREADATIGAILDADEPAT